MPEEIYQTPVIGQESALVRVYVLEQQVFIILAMNGKVYEVKCPRLKSES